MELMKQIEAEVEQGAVTEYSETAARIAELKNTYGTEVPDASTKDGYDRAKKISSECTSLRTALEKRRKEFKAPVLAFGKMIDSEAKRITAEIVSVEEPFKSAYKAVDDEKKRIKAEIEQRFVDIKDMPSKAVDMASGEIEAMINDLAEYDVSKSTFGRRVDEASALVASTLDALTERHVKAIEAEQEALRIEAERAELEALRREREYREREAREAEAKAAREAEEARIAEDAVQKAIEDERRRAAEESARIEKEKADAIAKAEKAERDRIAAEEQAKRNAELAEKRRIEEAEKAEAKRIADIEAAKQAEIQRQKDEAERQRLEQERLEANQAHAKKIHNEMLDDFIAAGLNAESAKLAVTALVKNEVRNIGRVNY